MFNGIKAVSTLLNGNKIKDTPARKTTLRLSSLTINISKDLNSPALKIKYCTTHTENLKNITPLTISKLTRTNMTSQINQSSIIGAHEATINRSSREMERRRNRRER